MERPSRRSSVCRLHRWVASHTCLTAGAYLHAVTPDLMYCTLDTHAHATLRAYTTCHLIAAATVVLSQGPKLRYTR